MTGERCDVCGDTPDRCLCPPPGAGSLPAGLAVRIVLAYSLIGVAFVAFCVVVVAVGRAVLGAP